VTDPRGGRDSLPGSGDGPLFLLGSSCRLGVEKPQVQVVGLMATAPPFNGVAAGGRAGAAVPRVAVEGPVRAEGGAEPSPNSGCSKGESDRGGGGYGRDRPGGPGERPQEGSSACRGAAGHRVGAGRRELLGSSLASRVRVGGEERRGCGAASEPPAGAARSCAECSGSYRVRRRAGRGVPASCGRGEGAFRGVLGAVVLGRFSSLLRIALKIFFLRLPFPFAVF